MNREIDDTPNTPGTVGYDPSKPATVSGSRPGVPMPKVITVSGREERYAETETRHPGDIAAGPDPRPWASGHCSYDILNNVTDLRLSLTVEGINYSGLVAKPGGAKEIVAMLRALADQVESGRA